MVIKELTLKLTFYKAAVHHVEEDRHHDVQQLALLCHVPRQLLVAEELHADMYNAVRHGVRLVALHQRRHDERVMLNKCFCESDLRGREEQEKKPLRNQSWLSQRRGVQGRFRLPSASEMTSGISDSVTVILCVHWQTQAFKDACVRQCMRIGR